MNPQLLEKSHAYVLALGHSYIFLKFCITLTPNIGYFMKVIASGFGGKMPTPPSNRCYPNFQFDLDYWLAVSPADFDLSYGAASYLGLIELAAEAIYC